MCALTKASALYGGALNRVLDYTFFTLSHMSDRNGSCCVYFVPPPGGGPPYHVEPLFFRSGLNLGPNPEEYSKRQFLHSQVFLIWWPFLLGGRLACSISFSPCCLKLLSAPRAAAPLYLRVQWWYMKYFSSSQPASRTTLVAQPKVI